MKYSGHRELLCEFSKFSEFHAFISSSDSKRTLMHFSCLQIPPRENWFQYVRRVYATGINFPCMSTLHLTNIYRTSVLAPVLQACSLYDDLRVLNQRN